MAPSIPQPAVACHRLLPETAGAMAKADLRKTEIGSAVERMRLLCGLSLAELAACIGRDERQIARWISGAERPQLDALFAVEALRQPLVLALAELADVEIVTQLTLRRRA